MTWRVLAGIAAILTVAATTRAGDRLDSPLAGMHLTDMDGHVWTGSDLADRVVLIDFWATWCAPCLADLPYLKQARARHPRSDFEVLGVSFDVSDRRSFVSWLNRQAVGWPQVFDGRGRSGPAARHFRVVAVPTSFLVSPGRGVVAMNLRGERLLAAIDAEVTALRDRRARTAPRGGAQGASPDTGAALVIGRPHALARGVPFVTTPW